MSLPSPEMLISFLLIRFPVLLLAVALHEFAHCWTGDRLGDDTPRLAGRVTLNPLAHLDPMGTIMMVVSSLSGFGIGWGKPSPMNPANFQHPARDRMLGAIAGPLCNLLQMVAWASIAVLVRSFVSGSAELISEGEHAYIYDLCAWGIIINACLAIFNMLPIFPLDGHHVLSYLAPRSWRPIIDNPIWMLLLLAVVLIPQISMLVPQLHLPTDILGHIIQPILAVALLMVHFLVGWP